VLHVLKTLIPSLLAPLLLSLPSTSQAQQSYPYSCEWVSEVTPGAVIRFSSTNGIGDYKGTLLYKGKRVMAFIERQSQGYGSRSWRRDGENAPSGAVLVFSGNQVVRGTPGFGDGNQPKGAQRVLLEGLGSALYYGWDQQMRKGHLAEPRWRNEQALLTAGEGFWRSSPGCRSLFLGRS
jgi:hypothetical protein